MVVSLFMRDVEFRKNDSTELKRMDVVVRIAERKARCVAGP